MKNVYLHGFMGSGADWDTLKEKEDYCPDLPGFGHNTDSFKNKFHALKSIADNIRHCDNLIGYSMGGRIALELVFNFNLPVRNLFLLASHPGLNSDALRLERLKSDQLLFQNNFIKEDFFNNWYDNPIFKVLKKSECFPHLLKTRLQDKGERWNEGMNYFSLGLQEDFSSKIARSEFDIHYLVGSEDLKFMAIAHELKDKASNIHLHILDGVDHGIPWLMARDKWQEITQEGQR